jgi:hypothetical protein
VEALRQVFSAERQPAHGLLFTALLPTCRRQQMQTKVFAKGTRGQAATGRRSGTPMAHGPNER